MPKRWTIANCSTLGARAMVSRAIRRPTRCSPSLCGATLISEETETRAKPSRPGLAFYMEGTALAALMAAAYAAMIWHAIAWIAARV